MGKNTTVLGLLVIFFTYVFEFVLISLCLSASVILSQNLFLPIRILFILFVTNILFVGVNAIGNKIARTINKNIKYNSLHFFVDISYRNSLKLSRLIFLSKDGTGMPSFFYKLFGLKCGKNCHIGGHIFEPFLIELGDDVWIGYDAILSGHILNNLSGDVSIGKTKIGSNVLIGGRATILPNVNIGNNVIIGFNSYIPSEKKLESNSVYAGTPVKKIKDLE